MSTKELSDEQKMSIRGCFYSWVIKDPYPEVTRYETYPAQKNKPDVTIHSAWQQGFEFAKKLVLDRLEEL